MRKIFVALIIFACVEMYVSQDTDRPHPYADLEPFGPEDFNKPPKIEPAPCLIPHKKCQQKIKRIEPVCALEYKRRLTNYNNKCRINLENCLARPVDDKTGYGVVSKNDIIYYNGKNHTCYYYFKKAGIKDAVTFYYKVGYAKEGVDDNKIDTQV